MIFWEVGLLHPAAGIVVWVEVVFAVAVIFESRMGSISQVEWHRLHEPSFDITLRTIDGHVRTIAFRSLGEEGDALGENDSTFGHADGLDSS